MANVPGADKSALVSIAEGFFLKVGDVFVDVDGDGEELVVDTSILLKAAIKSKSSCC